MEEHLRRVSKKDINDHYYGKIIQDQLINLLANSVLVEILGRIQKARYFSVILDCTPDISDTDQMSFTDSELLLHRRARDSRISCFKLLKKTTSKSIIYVNKETTMVLTWSEKTKAFKPGSSNWIREQHLCHVCAIALNLVIADAASSSRTCMTLSGILQRIYVLFPSSTRRWDILKGRVKNFTLKPLCTTRWESGLNTVKPIKCQTKDVYEALMDVFESDLRDPAVQHEAINTKPDAWLMKWCDSNFSSHWSFGMTYCSKSISSVNKCKVEPWILLQP